MPESKLTFAKRIVNAMLTKVRTTLMLGMVVLSAAKGMCCMEVRVREDMLNGDRTCHDGMLFSKAESASENSMPSC